jgi:hypothetical protein
MAGRGCCHRLWRVPLRTGHMPPMSTNGGGPAPTRVLLTCWNKYLPCLTEMLVCALLLTHGVCCMCLVPLAAGSFMGACHSFLTSRHLSNGYDFRPVQPFPHASLLVDFVFIRVYVGQICCGRASRNNGWGLQLFSGQFVWGVARCLQWL